MTELMWVYGALTIISIMALLGLVYVYYKNLKKIKSKFTIGLLVFAILFLVQNVISLYFYVTRMEYYVPEVELHMFFLSLLQTLGFLVLLKITWE
ncbi:hypothetical protein HYU22_05795 [Candidatus Woesearchaeota archaeon]|nr:hypothetical protein [Candidatus Woesearchaeota archaeon]